jgi:hypothetical protein
MLYLISWLMRIKESIIFTDGDRDNESGCGGVYLQKDEPKSKDSIR